MSAARILYLGYAFPPGLAALYPAQNPAGHGFETRMISELRQHFEIRSAGILRVDVPTEPLDADPRTGIAHDILLKERSPEIVTRRQALASLKRRYKEWQAEGWVPDVVLVYNLGAIYDKFIRWLRQHSPRPRLVLLLLDSVQLGSALPLSKRLRYRFKPFVRPDAEVLKEFDACIGLSTDTENYFKPSGTPFCWMPGACNPNRITSIKLDDDPNEAPISFGYFGALAAHAGVQELVEVFLQSSIPGTLHVCGYGKLSDMLSQLAHNHQRIHFAGLLSHPDDCLAFGRACDVLVNPRPPGFGNQNNFPSKLFDYALCGRAILTSRISGVERVLGDEAFYYDVTAHPTSLRNSVERIAGLERAELRRRGEVIRTRVCEEFNWPKQAERIASFLRRVSVSLAQKS